MNDAEATLNQILLDTINRYVKKRRPIVGVPTPWWNKACDDAFRNKQAARNKVGVGTEWYSSAVRRCRRVQRRAYKRFNTQLRHRLAKMSTSDKTFWSISKEIGGISSQRTAAAPDAEDLVQHFASKMSNAKEIEDPDFVPVDSTAIPLSSFKIRRKAVFKMLKNMDPSKSANGVHPRFRKECAVILTNPVTSLFRFMVYRAYYVTR